MTTATYYIENCPELDEVLEEIEETFACWLEREFIEMNYSEISLLVRNEDIASVEKMLAPLM